MFQQNHSIGLAALVLATLFFGLYGVLSRILGTGYGVFFQTAARSALILLIFFPYILWRGNWPSIRSKDFYRFLVLGTVSVISFSAIFVAFNFLPIGLVLLVYYFCSTVTGYIIGSVFFRERITVGKIVALVVALFGLSLLFFTAADAQRIGYLVLAFFSGIATAVWYALSKKLAHRYTITQILFVDQVLVVGISIGLAYLLHEPALLPGSVIPWLVIAAFAVITIVADVLTIYGFSVLPVQIASIALLLEAVFGALFGWLFFREVVTPVMALGGLMILSGIAISYRPGTQKF